MTDLARSSIDDDVDGPPPLPSPRGFRPAFRLVGSGGQVTVDVTLERLVPVRRGNGRVLVPSVLGRSGTIRLAPAPGARGDAGAPGVLAFRVPPDHPGIPFSPDGILGAVVHLPAAGAPASSPRGQRRFRRSAPRRPAVDVAVLGSARLDIAGVVSRWSRATC